MIGSIGIIYVFGAAWFSFITGFDMMTTAKYAVLPFIALDIAKAVVATGVATMLVTQKPYGPEIE